MLINRSTLFFVPQTQRCCQTQRNPSEHSFDAKLKGHDALDGRKIGTRRTPFAVKLYISEGFINFRTHQKVLCSFLLSMAAKIIGLSPIQSASIYFNLQHYRATNELLLELRISLQKFEPKQKIPRFFVAEYANTQDAEKEAVGDTESSEF